MAKYINKDMARDLYSDAAGPVSPYGEDGRISDADFAHEIALGTDKSMTVASQAKKLGESAVARFAELRAETFELQYFSPAVNNAINQGMAQARESEFSEDERTKQHERVDLYIDLMQRRHAIQSEIASLYEEHSEKELETDFERVHRGAIRERKEQIRAELAVDSPTYSPLQYSSEYGTVLRKRLPEAILVGMTSIATELLERHGVISNTKSVWGKQPDRLDSLVNTISDHISSKYNGTLGPVTIEEIPFSEEEKRAYILSGIAPREINTASLARLRVSVLHKSLSKDCNVSGQADVLMYVVFDEKNGDYVSCTKRMAGEWHKNTKGAERDWDSSDRATIIEAHAASNPVNGGLPTLGKKR